MDAVRPGAAFLVVECRGLLHARCLRTLRERVQIVQLATIAEAEARIAERRWMGAIVGLPVGGGALAWLASLRERRDKLPVLIVADALEKEVTSVCHRLDARCVFAPLDAPSAVLFAARAVAERAGREQRIDAVVEKLALERGLSPREADIARLAAIGVSRAGLAASLGVSENTVKAYVRGLLSHTGAASVDALGRAILEQVVLSPRELASASEPPPGPALKPPPRGGGR